jgi:hypothetical protein
MLSIERNYKYKKKKKKKQWYRRKTNMHVERRRIALQAVSWHQLATAAFFFFFELITS